MTSRLSRAEKMQTHVLGSHGQNHALFSDEVERWSGVGHAHGVRNQCTSEEFWSTSSVRQVLPGCHLVRKGSFCFCTCAELGFRRAHSSRKPLGAVFRVCLSCHVVRLGFGWVGFRAVDMMSNAVISGRGSCVSFAESLYRF